MAARKFRWKKSSFSGTGGCVEVSSDGELVMVRDSKHRAGGELHFTPVEWTAFTAAVRAGEFDC